MSTNKVNVTSLKNSKNASSDNSDREDRIKAINNHIEIQARRAMMHRNSDTTNRKKSLTEEFFEGVHIAKE